MKIDVLTLFPAMFAGPLEVSIVQRARTAGRLHLQIHNLRDYARDRHKSVDDKPFGGGPGMVLKPEPLFEAVEAVAGDKTHVLLMTPVGRRFNQALARELAQREELLLICGSYEGVDERVRQALVDEEISIGDYPQYTRPAEFRGMKVPEVLLSGHHAEIEKWRAEQARLRTEQRRPDLLNEVQALQRHP